MTLPLADAAFRWSDEGWGSALRCVELEPIAQHLFTTRELQLRPFERRAAEWAAAVGAVGGTLARLRRIRQVHGRAVHVARAGDHDSRLSPPEADAIVSATPGHLLAVQVADCLPLLIADPKTGAVGAVHAGWRGTAANIARAAVSALADEFGARPEDLRVAIGPGIGPCCYQVGAELIDVFRAGDATEHQLATWFTRAADGSLRLDVWTANYDQLLDAGVAANHVFMSRLCTQTHASLFDSYRAAGPAAGRMAALIVVPTKDTKGPS